MIFLHILQYCAYSSLRMIFSFRNHFVTLSPTKRSRSVRRLLAMKASQIACPKRSTCMELGRCESVSGESCKVELDSEDVLTFKTDRNDKYLIETIVAHGWSSINHHSSIIKCHKSPLVGKTLWLFRIDSCNCTESFPSVSTGHCSWIRLDVKPKKGRVSSTNYSQQEPQ